MGIPRWPVRHGPATAQDPKGKTYDDRLDTVRTDASELSTLFGDFTDDAHWAGACWPG